ncbi:MAG: GNAT family N-acetyltransferase [Anaerolineae bacterium]
MPVYHTAVTDRDHDFQQVWDLLTETHRPARRQAPPAANYWSFCRFEGWMVFSAPPKGDRAGLTRKLHLWRADAGRLIGLAIVEGNGCDVHVISDPDHREIEREIYTWVEANWSTEENKWVTYAEAGDAHREALLTGLGYRARAEAEYLHVYDLTERSLNPTLPPGFSLSAAAEDGDHLGRERLSWLVFRPGWDPAAMPEPVRQHMPSYDPALDLVVVAPDGELVAFAAGWLNPRTQIAEVEPVGTHPAYRQRGLAKAVVTECFRRLRERGACWVHIASAPEPAVSNRLYQSLGPVGRQRFVRWEREAGPQIVRA